jgi:hypothetical protein
MIPICRFATFLSAKTLYVTVNFTILFFFFSHERTYFWQGADNEGKRSMDSGADVCVEYSRRFHGQQAGGAHSHAGVAAIKLGGAQSPERTIGWSACSFFDHAKS